MAYQLHIDGALSGGNYFGFMPLFGHEMTKSYFDYYVVNRPTEGEDKK